MKMSKQEAINNVILLLESLFRAHQISGILNVPKIGNFTIYSNIEGKLKILDFASTEIKAEEIVKQVEANNRAINMLNNKEVILLKPKEYIG